MRAPRDRLAAKPRPPVLGRAVGGDVGRLLAVVAAVRDEVLEDHLLQMTELGVDVGQRPQRRYAVFVGLPDPDQDAARERNAQLPGGADGGEPDGGLFGGEP